MSLLSFKIFSAWIMFAAAFVVGYFPARMSIKHSCRIHIYEALASGIFLGAALFHMLPDAIKSFEQVTKSPYPYSFVYATLTFVIMLVIQKISNFFAQDHLHEKLTGYLLTLAISIHSLIEGAALGISSTMGAAMVIFIAIIAHKSCASFAFVIKLKKTEDSFLEILTMLFIFSLMTPLGILAATGVSKIMMNHTGIMTEATLNAITAGTFFYIGTLDTIGRQMQPQRIINRFSEFTALLVGMSFMGIIAVWV